MKDNLEILIYIERDYDSALKLLENLFEDFLKNLPFNKKSGDKHKCNRLETCECIYLGENLIKIYLTKEKNNIDMIKVVEKYYVNPGINLPFSLFMTLSKSLIKLQNFQAVRSLIENYITYSKFVEKPSDQMMNIKSTNEINEAQYELLYDLLIFQVILVNNGFTKAKAKINSIKNENIKLKFIEKYYKVLSAYTNEKDQNLMSKLIIDNENTNENEESNFNPVNKYDKSLYNKITEMIDTKLSSKFSFDNIFSNYKIKNSILQKIILVILNRKFLIIAFVSLFIFFLRKYLKSKKLDVKLLQIIILLKNYLSKFRIFATIGSFYSGIFKLLVNY